MKFRKLTLFNINNNRESLEFAQETKSKFDFLVESHGFKQTFSSDTKVRYESAEVFVEIFHGEYDYEVGINFGRLGKNEDFSFLLFCRLMKVVAVTAVEMISDDRAAIKTFLITLSDALSTTGLGIVMGDSAIFEQMKTVKWWDFKPDALK